MRNPGITPPLSWERQDGIAAERVELASRASALLDDIDELLSAPARDDRAARRRTTPVDT